MDASSYKLQGDQIYRTVQPCRALGELDLAYVISGSYYDFWMQKIALDADVLYLCQCNNRDLLPLLMKRRSENKKTFFEISDNFFDLKNCLDSVSVFFKNSKNCIIPLQLASYSDGVVFPSKGLYQKFYNVHENIRVIPNYLWSVPPLKKKKMTQIGWAGSSSHLGDIKLFVRYIAKFLRDHPECTFHIMGDPNALNLWKECPENQLRIQFGGSLDDYYNFLDSIDIGIIAVSENDFSFCRSSIKYLEYISRSVLPICSRSFTYSGTIGENRCLWYSSFDEIPEKLNYALSYPEEMFALLKKAYEDISMKSIEKENIYGRYQFLGLNQYNKDAKDKFQYYSEIIKKTNKNSIVYPGYVHHFHNLEEQMIQIYNKSDSEKLKKKTIQALITISPKHTTGYSLMASMHSGSHDFEFWIKKALEFSLFPASLYFDWSHHHYMKNDIEECINKLKKSITIFSQDVTSHITLGELMFLKKDYKSAEHYFEYAFSISRYAAISAEVWIRYLCFKKELNRAFRIACDWVFLHAGNHEGWLLLSEIAFLLNNRELAIRYLNIAIERNEATPDFCQKVGQIYLRMNEFFQAQKWLNRYRSQVKVQISPQDFFEDKPKYSKKEVMDMLSL
jgi:glycosyltransferase involved in cell wall biosynthesis